MGDLGFWGDTVGDDSSRLEHVFSRSIARRRAESGALETREDLYQFVKQLQGEGIPVEASASVLKFEAMDFRRWLAGDQPPAEFEAAIAKLRRPPAPRKTPNRSGAATVRTIRRRVPPPSDNCDKLLRAFEGTVRRRTAELITEPPDHESGWFPLMRLLAGEGVPVEVSATILGVDVGAYRNWLSDPHMHIATSREHRDQTR